MKRTLMLSAAALVAGSGSAGAQDKMSEYDTDGDGYISSAELAAHAEGEFDGLDTDQSGGLSQEELASGQFSRYDVNQDDQLDPAEYRASIVGIDALRYMGQEPAGLDDSTYGAEAVGIDPLSNMGQDAPSEGAAEVAGGEGETPFAEFDTDGDTILDHDEYMMSLEDAFGMFDRDDSGELSPSELEQAQFSRFDTDDDGQLSEEEFQDWVAQQGS